VTRRAPGEADLAEAWTEVARLRRRALEAGREAAERRRLAEGRGGDPLHPRAQGLAAAAEFHEARAAEAAERAREAAGLAAELEARLGPSRVAGRCA
jgi:hypothetical protein